MFTLPWKKRPHQSQRHGEIVVSDPEIRTQLQFHGVTEEDLGSIAAWGDVCREVMDHLVDEFYKHILSNATTRGILETHTTVERQRPMLTRYVLTMFSGRIDDQYIAYRRHVGVKHDDINLDSNWYVAMYELIRQVLTQAVRTAGASQRQLAQFTTALSRLIQVDIALVITALTNARRAKIEALKEQEKQKASEAADFLSELAAVLQRLAACDLTARVQGDYPEAYTKIQQALNTAVDNLGQALTQVAVGAEQVAAASDQISRGSQDLAQGASEQASTLEEISSSLQEMTMMSKQNAANAQEARGLAENAHQSADQGATSMQRLSQAIEAIKTASDETANIVKTIDEIAFQTNLLALNAAVEAARAGDAGKGFAVVAEEVRNLAMRSAEAAKTTAQLIVEAIQKAESGVVINQEVLGNLEEIATHVRHMSTVIGEIAAASSQQQQGVEQLNTAVEQLNQITQATAASSEEAASAAEELSGQATEMQHMVGTFQLHPNSSSPGRLPSRSAPHQLPQLASSVGRQRRACGTLAAADDLFSVT
jgi:methyl-accepting chemotaxis protein